MSIIYILIPLAIIIVSLAIGIFFWAVKSNQFEDLERHGYSILFDDDLKSPAASDDKSSDKTSEVNQGVEDKKQQSIASNDQP
ncbi:cbb3-type cytochrome oxidase assembly protein CcoS [Paraglaciecola chathamensis]|uniref:Cytochrome oxidase maturation protein, cbb3-type n=1 Tax=Paraglaciecola chathamensis S18K6 TaxID=1127672 RepID=A0AAV3V678_9ALTE|nr:cbb3-type cytochrome oxidase assembly protein CcoS [Paraglaciecola chathamensis]GAC11910.1 cytochrome oxidase maturation protein, cbb3-type [Paraglaciecola chathamensis S18K6]